MTVYFVKSNNHVKIGYSSKPVERIKSLQTANPYPLEVLFFMPGNSATEKELHNVFNSYHQLNEWYNLEGDLLSFVNVASCVFSDYTAKLETDSWHQDEKDWEYWKNRALEAETFLNPVHKKQDIDIDSLSGTKKLIFIETKQNPTATQKELATLLQEKYDITISRQMVGKHQRSLNGVLK